MNDNTKDVVRQLKALGDIPSRADPNITPEQLMEALEISGQAALDQFKQQFPEEYRRQFPNG